MLNYGVSAVAGPGGLCLDYHDFHKHTKHTKKLFEILTVQALPVFQSNPRLTYRLRVEKAYRLERENDTVKIYFSWLFGETLKKIGIIGGIRAAPRSFIRPLLLQNCSIQQPLYDYQTAIVGKLCEPSGRFSDSSFQAFKGRAYLCMETGYGKSRTAIGVISRLQVPTLIIVPTKAIRSQWIGEIGSVVPGVTVAPYDNANKAGEPTAYTHDVVIGIVNTMRNKPEAFYEGYGLIVLDEAHELQSEKNMQILWRAQAPAVLGLSATPRDRPDGMDKIVPHFLGPILDAEILLAESHYYDKASDLLPSSFSGRVREVEYYGSPEFTKVVRNETGHMCTISTIGNIIRDPARMQLIVSEVKRLYYLHLTEKRPELLGLGKRGEHGPQSVRRHGIFVFAEHREYLPALRAVLLEQFTSASVITPELGPETADGLTAVLRGGASDLDLQQAQKTPIVLTTYGYSRRGVSITDMTAIVLATPRRTGLNQILGRITRKGSDQSIVRIVVDIKDMLSPLRSQNCERRKVYKNKGYPIYRVKALGGEPQRPETMVWAPDSCD